MNAVEYREILLEDIALAANANMSNVESEFLTYVTDILIAGEEFDDFITTNSQNARNVIKNLAREVAVMRCNMDMMLEDIEKEDVGEVMNVRTLKEKMRKTAVHDWHNYKILDKWV